MFHGFFLWNPYSCGRMFPNSWTVGCVSYETHQQWKRGVSEYTSVQNRAPFSVKNGSFFVSKHVFRRKPESTGNCYFHVFNHKLVIHNVIKKESRHIYIYTFYMCICVHLVMYICVFCIFIICILRVIYVLVFMCDFIALTTLSCNCRTTIDQDRRHHKVSLAHSVLIHIK